MCIFFVFFFATHQVMLIFKRLYLVTVNYFMKNTRYLFLYLLLVLLLKVHGAAAQAPGIAWQKTVGSLGTDVSQCVQQTPDGGYAVLGMTTDQTFAGPEDEYFNIDVTRLSATGDVLWRRLYGGLGNDFGYTIRNTVDGGFIVAASTSSTDNDVTAGLGGYDVWVLKLSAAGDIEWQKSFGGPGNEAAFDIRQTTDTGYIFVGRTSSANGHVTENKGGFDMWVVKLTPTGALQWQHTFGGTADDNLMSVMQTSDGGYIVAGDTYSANGDITGSHGSEDYWVAKLSASGSIEWKKCYGGANADYAQSVRVTPDGDYIIAGGSNSVDGDVTGNIGAGDMWIVKLSATGGIAWQRCYGSTANDAANSIEVTADGGFIVAGWASGGNMNVTGFTGLRDYWLVKLSETGALQWQKCLNKDGFNEANCVIQDNTGAYIVAGRAVSPVVPEASDGWVVALSMAADVADINIIEEYAAFPNPTTGMLFLNSVAASVSIYNTIGANLKVVYTTDRIDLGGLPSGVYTIVVTGQGAGVTHRLTVSKL